MTVAYHRDHTGIRQTLDTRVVNSVGDAERSQRDTTIVQDLLPPCLVDEGLPLEFLLARSTVRLIQIGRVIVDPVVSAAAADLDGEIMNDTPRSKELINTYSDVTPEVVRTLLSELAVRNRTVRGPLLENLENDISLKKSRATACPRLKSLRRDFADEEADPGARYSGWNFQRSLLCSAFLKCSYHRVYDRRNEVGAFTPDEEASAELAAFAQSVVAFADSGEGDKNPKWRYEIAKRILAVAKPIAGVLDEPIPDSLLELLEIACGPKAIESAKFSCEVGAN